MDKKQSAWIVTKKHFELEAYGRDKKEAYGAAFGTLKKKVYKEVDGLIIHMEPVDIFVLEEYEKTSVQKLTGFFKPRQNQDYYVKLEVVTMLKYIPM